MDIQIRPIEAGEVAAFCHACETAFGDHADPESIELFRSVFELDRSLAALDGSTIVGTTGALTMRLTTPGGELGMAGVTAVGVLPSHRRRGILTSLMRRQLQDVRDAGEPLAGLWASEGGIYGRFGYGLSCFDGRLEADRERSGFVNLTDDPGRVRLVDRDEALRDMPAVYERRRPLGAGMLSRTEAMWAKSHADLERWRDGASAIFYALHETAGRTDGYTTYRVKSEWPDGIPGGKLIVRELVAETPQAYAALWGYVFAMDLVKTVDAWGRPSDEPLLHMVVEPRRLRFRLTDALYLRVVDVTTTLAGRRYGTEGSIVLEVRDDFCPWNEGRYRLEAGTDGADCRLTTESPDLVLGARELAAAFLGGVRFGTLARAGRVDEERPGALELAGRMFAADPAPWCPVQF